MCLAHRGRSQRPVDLNTGAPGTSVHSVYVSSRGASGGSDDQIAALAEDSIIVSMLFINDGPSSLW